MADDEKVETERVVMLWPKALKEQVRETAGKRGITEFTLKAVNVHLGIDADLEHSDRLLNETRHFAQQLADQLVLGGGTDERLQFLMELEFPTWVSTQGWPAAYAERVRPPVPVAAPEPAQVTVSAVVPPKERPPGTAGFSTMAHPKPESLPTVTEEQAEQLAEIPPEEVPVFKPIEDLPHDTGAGRDDLFAKVMAKTGGALADVPGLTVASAIPKPEPVVQKDLCPSCSQEMIDGECWTCAL